MSVHVYVHVDADITAAESELYKRAVMAWYRSEPSPAHPVEALSGLERHDDRDYVVLRNARGVLAVYRRCNDDKLKRIRKRLPNGIGNRSAQPAKRPLTPEEIVLLIPDDAWRGVMSPGVPAAVREAYVRGRRNDLSAWLVVVDVDMQALVRSWREFDSASEEARSRLGDSVVWDDSGNGRPSPSTLERVDEARTAFLAVVNGTSLPPRAARRAPCRPAVQASARRPRSRDRRSRRAGARVARTTSGDSDDPASQRDRRRSTSGAAP